MAILRYETLGDFYEEYPVTNICPIKWKQVDSTVIALGSLKGTGFVLMYYTETPSGFYKGKAFVADQYEKLLPLYENFRP